MFVGGGGMGGGLMFSVFVRSKETGPVKNNQGECSLKVTRPNGERSKTLVSNPGDTKTIRPFALKGHGSNC